MTYAVKEIFRSICGEGFHAGRVAVFCRLSGCNLWSGREADRSSAVCRFCDTNFIGGERLAGSEIAERIESAGPSDLVVFTGGEPALQLDDELYRSIRYLDRDFAIETNGTKPVPDWLDYVAMSPKAGASVVLNRADEIKIVYPQDGLSPDDFAGFKTTHRYVQPMDGPKLAESTKACIDYVLANPSWRLSVQTHKIVGLR